MRKTWIALVLAAALLASCAACSTPSSGVESGQSPASSPAVGGGSASGEEILIALSDEGVTVDGEAASADPSAPVWTGAEIIYYRDGTDETYGEGSEEEKHSQAEAEAHTVVTISRPGVYRVSGSLSQGQIFVDLGEEAKTDSEAVVTLILDDVDITCTVAPAIFFYRVYECDQAWVAYDDEEAGDYEPSPTVDTSAAGANVILAAGSENRVSGSHVARIYEEGTTKKLHKYDGAFYSRMSMNLWGDGGDDSGSLHVVADNEGLNSELHLTIHGGTISIESQDDGINTNEDGVSVATLNGGSLTINAGLGAEGDGIDSNGYLTINGGQIRTMANERSPDGGIDADGAITINGGTLYAFGTRNDAVDSASAQPYMELFFASTLPAGSEITLQAPEGGTAWSTTTEKACQSITLTSPALALDTAYSLYVDGVLQCYSGNQSGMMMGGGPRPGGMEPPEGFQGGTPPEGMEPPEGFQGGTPPEGMEPPEGFQGGTPPGGFGGGQGADGSGSTEFVLTEEVKTFSGVCDSDSSGKTRLTFTVEGVTRSGPVSVIGSVTAITPSAEVDPALVQITVTDNPSEDYSASCLLSDGLEAVNALLPTVPGNYLMTVAVASGTGDYTGALQISFVVEDSGEAGGS